MNAVRKNKRKNGRLRGLFDALSRRLNRLSGLDDCRICNVYPAMYEVTRASLTDKPDYCKKVCAFCLSDLVTGDIPPYDPWNTPNGFTAQRIQGLDDKW